MFRKELITHIDRDSAALGVLDSVAHRVVEEPGRYQLVCAGRLAVRVATLVVDESGPQSAAVDLAVAGEDPGCGCGEAGGGEVVVAPGGLLTFSVESGHGPYHALIRTGDDAEPLFDTRRLGAGDLVAFVLLRPGTYRLGGAVEGEVVVAYPKRGGHPSIPKEPVRLVSGKRGRQPRKAALDAGQPLIVELADGGSVSATLVAPDDRPRPVAPRRTPADGRRISVKVVADRG
ncbi:hypothetical protein [Microbacterium sp. SD291]|uniref:hypothetical protein n=1 Tax=Microbacterium sp. SD291 TaxID=2782007 RepID=UPI001A9755DD|nr:hypothetical protein [Microbacterium sp. SD291]MBO0980164.1 hypothetical protein [Microbacterium sp. SD291]